jgi:hypothetical protein
MTKETKNETWCETPRRSGLTGGDTAVFYIENAAMSFAQACK